MKKIIFGLLMSISYNVLCHEYNSNALTAINYEKKTVKNPIIVATIDTGLSDNENISKYVNTKETGLVSSTFCSNSINALSIKKCNKSTNEIDDDNNGYVDDVNGWDFVNNRSWFNDNHGHGTHVAGIIASKKYGVAHGTLIMPLNYYIMENDYEKAMKLSKKYKTSNFGELALLMSTEGLNYAVDNGAKIINYSGGGPFSSQSELSALKNAERKGVLVIVAAGNEGSNLNIKTNEYFPCSYNLPNVICVGNYNQINNTMAESSNYGKSVDVFAPGYSILSDSRINEKKNLTGASQSTPYVTGLAALIWSENPSLTYSEVKKIILNNVSVNINLKSYSKTNGVIDFKKSLNSVDSINRKIAVKN